MSSFDAVAGPRHIRFSPDAEHLTITGSVAICVHDRATGKQLPLEGNTKFEWVAFSGDGTRLVAASGYDAAVWELKTGKQLARYNTQPVYCSVLALDRAGAVLAVSSGEKSVAFLDPMTGKRTNTLLAPEKFCCLWASFQPDGKTMLLGDQTGVTWWDPVAGKVIRRFEGMAHHWRGGENPPARFSPDGTILVGLSERMLPRWDAATAKPLLGEFHDAGHQAELFALGVSADGKWIATGGSDTGVRVWSAATGRTVARIPTEWNLYGPNVELTADGRFVFAPGQGGGVTKWEVTTGRPVVQFGYAADTPKRGSLMGLRLSPDGRTLVAVSGPSSSPNLPVYARWDTESGKSLVQKPLDRFPMAVSLSPDGRWIATDQAVYPIDVGQAWGSPTSVVLHPFKAGTFSADGRLLVQVVPVRVESEFRGRVVVAETTTGTKVTEIPTPVVESYARPAFHPDGRTVVTAGAKGLTFFDLPSGKAFAEQKIESEAYIARYFPDGTKLVTGHVDTTALVWPAPARPNAARQLDAKGRAAAWDDLASADGAKGWAAVWALADDPGGLAFLRERVKPVEVMTAKEFDKLLADLDSDDFAARDAAEKELAKVGERAVERLRAARKGDLSPEQRTRVGRLLGHWSGPERRPTGEQLRIVRAVAAVELSGTADARKLLTELAVGTPDATATREAKAALERTGR